MKKRLMGPKKAQTVAANVCENNPKIGVNTLIWTVKGDQKSDPEFQKLINLYRD